MLARAKFDDVLERDGEMLILVGNDVTLLSALGAALVEACALPREIEAIEAEVVRKLGAPEGANAREIVREAVGHLVSRGILIHR